MLIDSIDNELHLQLSIESILASQDSSQPSLTLIMLFVWNIGNKLQWILVNLKFEISVNFTKEKDLTLSFKISNQKLFWNQDSDKYG